MPALTDASVRAVERIPRTGRGIVTALVTIVAVLLLLIPIGIVVQIVLTSQFDDRTQTQAIVVLDPGRVWADHQEIAAARLDHAAELYGLKVAPAIILIGRDKDTVSEKKYLVAKGVPADDIVGFTAGGDTVGALHVMASVMKDLAWSSITIVTDPANAARADATATAYGIDAHLSPTKSGPGTALTSDYVGRETAALLRYYLVTRWTQPQILGTQDANHA